MSASHNNGIRPLLSREQIDDPGLCEVYDYWLTKKGADAFPPASSIDIMDFPAIARFWAIMNVVEGGKDYAFRFVGTELVEFVSFEPTGRSLSEFGGDEDRAPFMAHVREILDVVIRERGPVTNGPRVTPLGHRKSRTLASINLPLSHGGKSISQILTVIAISTAS